MTRRACRAWVRALKHWLPAPACLWRVLFADLPGGHRSTRAGW